MLVSTQVHAAGHPVTATADRKARGAFYTPPEIANYLAQWAIRKPGETVLEPSCGEASLLQAAWRRLDTLARATGTDAGQVLGYEIDPVASAAARRTMAGLNALAEVEARDFFDVAPSATADAVIGNPPYIRYQSFSGAARAKAQRAALAGGVRIDGLASSWAAFVVHASRFLKEDGRLALVLPAELLHARYAAPVRRHLMQRFREVTLVLFEQLVFPDVMSEVVLLLAKGTGTTDSIELVQVEDVGALQEHRTTRRVWTPDSNDSKWSAALVGSESLEPYEDALASAAFAPLANWGAPYLGAVSGNNGFFRIRPSRAAALGLGEEDLLDVLPPGSRALRGLTYSRTTHQELTAHDEPTRLFHPNAGSLSAASEKYIQLGEDERVDHAYKCRVRSPWWQVPLPRVADVFITYMSHEGPRLVTNGGGVQTLNSVHGLVLNSHKRLGKELLPLAALNSVTSLGAELVGRSYGGGVLKLEPREAGRLPMPTSSLLAAHESELRAIKATSGPLLRAGKLDDLRAKVDRVLLSSCPEEPDLVAIRTARDELRARRHARSRSA